MTTLQQENQQQLVQQIQTSKLIEKRIKQAVQIIGNANRYQVILIIYLILCFIFATYLLAGSSYFFMNPKFNCNGELLTEDQACLLPDSCTIQNSYTITTKVKLICDKRTERSVIQSMLGIGACLGVLFINFISDYKGRKFSFVFSLLTGIASTATLIIGAYTEIWQLFIVSQILGGFYGNSIMTLIYVMGDRLMSKKYSSFTILITNAFFGLAEISLILFTGYFDWQDLSIGVMLVPGVLLLALSFFIIIEDPVYLFTNRQYQQCKESLKTIAAVNKREQELQKCYQIVEELKNNEVGLINVTASAPAISSKLKYFRLISKKQIYIPILLIGIYNTGGNLTYYMLNYVISTVGTSFNINIALFGVVEFIGIFPMMWVGEKTPRKKGILAIIIAHVIVSLFFIMQLSSTVQTVLIVFIRFIFTSCYMLYIFFVVETFPQHIQATCFGIVEFISQTGKFFAPFCIDLSDVLRISPILLTGIISFLLCILPLLPLKESLVKKQKEERDELKQSLLQ